MQALLIWIVGSFIVFSVLGATAMSFILFFGLGIGAIIYAVNQGSKVTANEEMFEQSGVRVEFKTGTLIINNKTYHVNQVTGITTKKISFLRSIVSIKLDDFKTPIQKVDIMESGGGTKFIQRFETALRKAGGPNFY